jgi:hypothetical protein
MYILHVHVVGKSTFADLYCTCNMNISSCALGVFSMFGQETYDAIDACLLFLSHAPPPCLSHHCNKNLCYMYFLLHVHVHMCMYFPK